MRTDKKSEVSMEAPYGWFLAGSHPLEYKAKLDKKIFHSGSRSCCVKCDVSKPSGWTTLMQNMGAKPYFGKRLRMGFWVRTEDVGYVSGWMRVDGSRSEILAFDNMCNRKIEGSCDWVEQEIVLDIPDTSTNIGFGVIFSGLGKMWVDDVSFNVVSDSVSTTVCDCSTGKHYKPAKNLNFESDEPG